MNVWRWAGAVVFVGAVALGVTAYGEQGGDKLVWKAFDNNDKPFWQEMTTKTKQTMKVQNMEVVQDQSQTFWIKWTPKSSDKDNWVVEQEIVGVKMNIKIGGNEIAFDSQDKNPPNNPLTDFFKALVGSKFTLTISKKDLKVISVDQKDLDKFIDKLAQANDQLKPLLKSILSKDALIQMSDPTFAAFPQDQVLDPSKPWKRAAVLDMGPIGTYDTTYTYTPEGGSNKDKIKVSATMTYKAPDDKKAGGLPFTIKGGSLNADKAEGVVVVDPAAGRIKSSEMKLDLKGNLKIDIGGMETNVDLTQNQTSTLTTTDTDPFKK